MIAANQRHAASSFRLAALVLGCSVFFALSLWSQELKAPSATDELLRHVKLLSSSELTGRGVDTPGIKLARDYIAKEFASYGLRPGGDGAGYLQSFDVAVGVTVKQPSQLTLGDGASLRLDEDWTPLGLSANGHVEAPLVFAGYGISADDHDYDDYAGIDVKGKIVVVLRYEPTPKDPKSPFKKAPRYSRYATLRSKANNALDHGALAMILVDLDDRGDENEPLITTRSSLWRSGKSLLAVQIRRTALERYLHGHGIELKKLKEQIDREGKPASQTMANASAKLQVALQEERARADNVVGVLPGADPNLANQNIVIGAHYDHLGFGHIGARDRSAVGAIHHGADDNASGTAVLLELARRLSQLPVKPARTILFVAFSAEELGLFGSRHFVEQVKSITDTKAMINLDMVGRLRDQRLTVSGARSGERLNDLISAGAKYVALDIRNSDEVERSDHMSFYNKKVPVLHLTTGIHADYHRPSDTWEKLNIEGMARISDLAFFVISRLADAETPPSFVSLPLRPRPPSQHSAEAGAIAVYLGTMPDYGADAEGVRLADVASGSPAAQAGLRAGDIITKLAGARIHNVSDLTDALGKRKPGEQIEIEILRMNQPLTLKAFLGRRG